MFNIVGASLVRVQINGERVAIDISHLVRPAVAVVMCQAVIATVAAIIVQIKRKHRQFHTRVISEKVPTPMTHIINNLHGQVACKILKTLHRHAFGQSHISIVQGRQIQLN